MDESSVDRGAARPAPSPRVRASAWRPAPKHPTEAARLVSLAAYGLVDNGPEVEYDRVVRLAQRLLGVPIAFIAFLDEDRMVCKAEAGCAIGTIPREESLCGHAILHDEPLLIRDVRAHPVYRHSPAVQRFEIGFYMGIVLKDPEGLALGTLCLIDREPRDPSLEWIEAATDFAEVVRDEMARSRADRETRILMADLQRSQRLYSTLVAAVPGAVFRVIRDRDGRMRYSFVSEGIRDLCGIEAEAYIAMTNAGASLVHPEDLPALRAEYEASARTLEPIQWQGRVRAQNGRYRWIQTTARPDVLEDGTIKWSGIVTDITPLKLAEIEIREMNRTLEMKVSQRTEQLRSAQIEMLTRLGRAAESRDDDTGIHIARVARLAEILARGLGLEPSECEMIRLATPMHDIGKISVPDAVLTKPGRLNEAEILAMRRHAAEGARMLEGGTTDLVQMAETIARTHHERWDGTGYPYGLAGKAIPLVGRIVAVADVFDALISERPYKRAWRVLDAVEEIQRGAGTHFDPEIVRVFAASLAEIGGIADAPTPLAA